MYDTTPPEARVTADFYSTSDPNRLTGSAISIDESAIDFTNVSVIPVQQQTWLTEQTYCEDLVSVTFPEHSSQFGIPKTHITDNGQRFNWNWFTVILMTPVYLDYFDLPSRATGEMTAVEYLCHMFHVKI